MFDQLVTPDRLRAAWDLVSRDGLGAGGDGEGVATFQAGLDLRLARLAADLLGGTYRPGPWLIAGGAVVAPVADRVVMTAVATGLPDPSSDGDPAAVMARLAALGQQGAVHLLDGTITHVTDLVPHDLLCERLAALGGDARLVDLVGMWLAVADPEDGLGVPPGLPVSGLLARLHLGAVAARIAAAGVHLVPAAGEILVLATGAAAAEDARGRMLALLADHGLYVDVDLPRMIRLDQAGPRLGRIMARMMAPPRPADPAPGAEGPARPLYLLTPGHRLGIDDRAFTVEAAETGDRLDSRPAAAVSRIELAPGVQAAAATLRAALARDIPVALLDGMGGVQAWLAPPPMHQAPRHLAQARHLLDPARRHALARLVVDARLQNMQALLKRLDRRKRLVSVEGAAERLKRIRRKLRVADTVPDLLAVADEAALVYWPALGQLIGHGWTLRRRLRRGATDPVNLVLDWLTALLAREIRTAATRHGLHPGFGACHEVATAEDGLVADLVEVFAAPLVETCTVYLFNNRILQPDDIIRRPLPRIAATDVRRGQDGGWRILPPPGRRVLETWEAQLDRVATGPDGEKASWRALIDGRLASWAAHVEETGVFRPCLIDY